jgi:hypothetical protein
MMRTLHKLSACIPSYNAFNIGLMAKAKPPGEKMKLVGVRMPPEQIRKIKKAAKAGRESFSGYIRRVCGVNP